MSRSNPQKPKRSVLKMISRTWLATGALVVCYGLTLTSCAPVADHNGAPRIKSVPNETPQTVSRLTVARDLWQSENGVDGDPYSAGFAAYEIASVTHDAKWSTEAIAKLGEAQDAMPGFALATAWRGSAHALAARDFPMQGAWQIVPGPGFVRMYHVKRAEALLNAAVSEAPNDPAVRLIRAATLANMPALLIDEGVAATDFAQLAAWDADHSLNPRFANILAAEKWRADFYSAYADHLTATGETGRAAVVAAKHQALNPTLKQQEVVSWNTAQIKQ